MSTTLATALTELSKQLGDYWAGTCTSAGAAGGTTVIDTGLKAKANDWITDDAYDRITSGTYDGEERKISSLDNTTGALTVLAHGGQIANAVTYEVHRLFNASDKRIALIAAARKIYPNLFVEIWDEAQVSGNWLKDGSLEIWTSATALTNWTTTSLTLGKTTTSPYYKHGLTSAKLSTAAGRITQAITNFDDLKHLAGKTVTFTIQGWCDTASCLRIAIYDGTTTTNSSYHDGDSAFTEDNDPLSVEATIGDKPTAIEFRILHDVAAGVSYADDARAVGPTRNKLNIGGLSLAQDRPHQVFLEQSDYGQDEPWLLIHGTEIDKDGYLYLPSSVSADYRLRIRGVKYLDFVDSADAASTAWTATIGIDQPQLDILIAEAACYLYSTMVMPNFTSGDRQAFATAYNFWQEELRRRKAKFSMVSPPATIAWSI